MTNQKGSLLIEMMISLSIGVFLTTGALQILLISKENYIAHEALSVVNNNGRLALDLMTSDLRMAGYKGCAGASQEIALGVDFDATSYYVKAGLDINEGIRGWEYLDTNLGDRLTYDNWLTETSFNGINWESGDVGAQTLTTVGKTLDKDFDLSKESDVIRIWFLAPYVAKLVSATDVTLQLDPTTMGGFPASGGNEEELLLVSNCHASILVSAKTFSSNGTVNLQNPLMSVTSSLSSMVGANVMMVRMHQYSIDKSNLTGLSGLHLRALKADGDFGNATEMVPAIMNMQLLYGIRMKTNPGVSAYVTAKEVTDWKKVVSVNLSILAENEMDNVVPKPVVVSYYGSQISPDNRRTRNVFNKTVTLRNRMLGIVSED